MALLTQTCLASLIWYPSFNNYLHPNFSIQIFSARPQFTNGHLGLSLHRAGATCASEKNWEERS